MAMSHNFDHWIAKGEASREQFFGLLQSGLDLLNQGLTVFNHELELVAWNQTFFSLLEFPQELARVGTPFADFMRHNAQRGEYGPGDVEQLVQERVRAARSFESHTTERTRPNGKIIAVRGEPLPGKGFITVYTDVTAQREFERLLRQQNVLLEAKVQERTADLVQTAEALRSSEDRLRVITDAIPALIAYCDTERRYRFVNRGYAEWVGSSKEQMVGRTISEVFGDEVYQSVLPQLDRLFATRQPVAYEYSRLRDQRVQYARSTVLPELDAAGRMLGFFVLSQDVTEQKRTQALLAQAQKMEAVGQLTGGVAHDFNNLLTVIIGNLAVLQHELGAQEAAREFVPPALAAAHRGVELVKRLLLFSRQESLDPTCIDAIAAVRGMLPLLRRSIPENIQVLIGEPEGNLHAMADLVALESALLNLALNARDAMPVGGELRMDLAAVVVEPPEAAELQLAAGAYVRIAVRDSGTGMNEATAARAFEPFFTTKAFGAGSGLGLAMVYGFATRSHGAVRIDSTPGAGTTVTLWLPRAEMPPTQNSVAGAQHTAPAHKPLVLLVEDDESVRAVVRRQVTALGYPVLEASNGEDATRLIEQVAEIGIVLSDIVMTGGMGGRELVRRARQLRPELHCVLMTGYEQGGSAEAGMEGVPLLLKPFAAEALGRSLDQAWAGP
jgi:PAS domain S-box-containing protein